MSEKTGERALQEFLSEAQEILDAFNRSLLRLDEDRATARFDPGAINDAFRAVHSLKGISGIFGLTAMTSLAHSLESLLDSLRLARVALTPEVLDLLFASIEHFQILVAEAGASPTPSAPVTRHPVDAMVERIARFAALKETPSVASPWGGFDLDANLLSVLTEYEEHRLRENIRQGRTLYRIAASFDLQAIDKGLEQLKARIKPIGELITFLPSAEAGDPDKLDLDVVLGAPGDFAAVERALDGLSVGLREVPRRHAGRPITDERSAAPARHDGTGAAQAVAPQEIAPRAREPLAMDTTPETDAMGGGPVRVASRPAATVSKQAEPRDDGAPFHDELEDRPVSLRSVAQTVRVDIRKLDHLLHVVGELSLVRAGLQAILDGIKLDRARTELARSLHHEVRNLGRKLDELQSGILEVRMVPLAQVFDKLSRVVRKISRDAGKEIRLVIDGADTELDKLIVEELSDPLMHVIRNCIDHGIEPRDGRIQAGKPEVGTISITGAQRGNHVVIVVEDDGAGLDENKLIERAIAHGYLDARSAGELGRREAFNLMFLPGVSTKDVADELSGRGVGMDVVKTNMSRLSGIIDVESERGRGTRISITLPITLAIIQALVIRVAGRTYAVPLAAVLESLLISPDELRTIERREVLSVRGSTLPILRLEDAFQLKRESPRPARSYVVVVGMAQHRIGVIVDELLGQQDIVIKSLGRSLDGIPGIAGATELGHQQTVLVLDVAQLVEDSLGHGVEAA